jgi:hypothetical protein
LCSRSCSLYNRAQAEDCCPIGQYIFTLLHAIGGKVTPHWSKMIQQQPYTVYLVEVTYVLIQYSVVLISALYTAKRLYIFSGGSHFVLSLSQFILQLYIMFPLSSCMISMLASNEADRTWVSALIGSTQIIKMILVASLLYKRQS